MINLDKLFICEEIGKNGETQWRIRYEDPIHGDFLNIDFGTAAEIIAIKNNIISAYEIQKKVESYFNNVLGAPCPDFIDTIVTHKPQA